jgi:hypothetical protein
LLFWELSQLIDIDSDSDTYWHERRCTCCHYVDNYVAQFIYKNILELINDEENTYLEGIKKLFDNLANSNNNQADASCLVSKGSVLDDD